jgi:hypothetical protein
MADIATTKGPNLPQPSSTYTLDYNQQLSNVLRLYFTSIDNATQQLIDTANSSQVQSWLDAGCY